MQEVDDSAQDSSVFPEASAECNQTFGYPKMAEHAEEIP